MPAALADAIAAIETSDATTTLRVGFVMGAPLWYRVAGGETVTLPRARCDKMAAMTDETSDELRAEQRDLRTVADLTGYVATLADLSAQIHLISIAIGKLELAGEDLVSTAAILAQAAADVRGAADTVKTAIDNALARLSDNASPADIQAAVDELTAAKATLDAATSTADTIDPNVTSGGVVDDGSGGVTEPTP